ncbi:MAG: endonuclease domain-containing protein [Clostridia bacterium]|nr:endonuclease domain-containing protein [Clostridia bacterium]
MPIEYERKMIPRAKELRKTMTPQETKLWYGFLKNYPVRFQRQKTISSFIADFYCFKAKLIVEVDGAQHYTAQGKAYDLERSAILDRYGLMVIRFTNQEVEEHFQSVCTRIARTVSARMCEET